MIIFRDQCPLVLGSCELTNWYRYVVLRVFLFQIDTASVTCRRFVPAAEDLGYIWNSDRA